MTSPPFALSRPKEYGNESQETYKAWFLPFADEFWRVLKPERSLVIDLGGAWEQGRPVKSLYAFELHELPAVSENAARRWEERRVVARKSPIDGNAHAGTASRRGAEPIP